MQKIIKQLKNYYNIQIKSMVSIDGGQVNNVWLVTTSKDEFILKKFSTTNNEDLNYEINIIKHLTKKNFPTPNIIKTLNHEYFFIFNNQFYILFKKLTQNSKRPSFNHCVDLYILFCQSQRNLHLKPRRNWLPIYECSWIKNNKNKKIYSKLFSILNYYEKKIKTTYKQLPKNIIHGDLKNENIIPTKEGLYLIDFGNSRYEARSLDIVHLADSFAKKNGIISVDHFLKNLALIHHKFKIKRIEKHSLLWILILHKINEVIFYSQKNNLKAETINYEIMLLHKNINRINDKILKL